MNWGRVQKLALLLEAAVLPVIYSRLALKYARAAAGTSTVAFHASMDALLRVHSVAAAGMQSLSVLASSLDFLQLAYCVLVAVVLLRAKPCRADFERPAHVLVPLLNILIGLNAGRIVGFLDGLPVLDATPIALPLHWYATGLALSAAGRVLSAAGILTLGRSFSIFVEMKDVVRGGIYRYMDHPIYFGYALTLLGSCLLRASSALAAFAFIQIGVLFWRAVLEHRLIRAAGAVAQPA